MEMAAVDRIAIFYYIKLKTGKYLRKSPSGGWGEVKELYRAWHTERKDRAEKEAIEANGKIIVKKEQIMDLYF